MRQFVSSATCAIELLESRQLLSVVPNGFTETTVASDLSTPMGIEIAPDGRIFLAEQTGKVRVIKNGALLATPALQLTVDSQGERGVLAVTFDPNFSTNKYIYVHYTAATPTIHNRISRFILNGDVADPASEQILLDLDNQETTFHESGDMHFGKDGKLYVTVGDDHIPTNAQKLTNLHGKVLRLNADGSIPTDNPFYNSLSGKNRAIWAYGLRNPYTFDIQPGTGTIFINDVGEATWEEINLGAPGANYGWPNSDGPKNVAGYTAPLFYYTHRGDPLTSGYAITGGTFYNPTTVEFPSSYVGKYFYTDHISGWIRVFDPSTKTASPFATGASLPVDLEAADDGSLYYLSRDTGSGKGALFRIRYGSNNPNPNPGITIVTHPQSQSVQPGSPVTFSVSASSAGALSYQWQRNGVDISGATSASYTLNPTVVGDTGAKFRVLVRDSVGNATLSNGANWIPGQAGSAINFDGVNDSVVAENNLNQWLGGTATLTAWIKTTQTGGPSFYQSPGITGVEKSGSNDVFWGWLDSTGKIGVQAGNTAGAKSSVSINDGQWHFVAFTRNASNGAVQVYVDGTLRGSATGEAGLKTSAFTDIGRIMGAGGTAAGYFKGAIDDFRIYNRVLTASELASAATLPSAGLVTRYDFDENTGTTTANALATGNTVTSNEATLTVVAAGNAPTASILNPPDGSLFTAGETINFTGSASDTEDGTLGASAFTWKIDLHHDTHSHPAMQETSGTTSGSFVLPTLTETSDNVWYRITLTVTDSSGRTATVTRDVLPRKATITLQSNVSGVDLLIDGQPVGSSHTFVGVAGVQRELTAPQNVTVNGIDYIFDGWSDGEPATHNISTPLINTTYTATYKTTQGAVYLSDLSPTGTPINGWGPIERDQSNGEKAAGDGKILTINSTTYAKGLGMHAGADVSYNLNNSFTRFFSDVGIDDEVGSKGTVKFQIYLDGLLTYDSGVMTGTMAAKQIDLNVTGANVLRLVLTNGGDNANYDHGDWANARLLNEPVVVGDAPVATILTPADGDFYTAGSVLNFSGSATDTEDGTLAADVYAWKIEQHHGDHAHEVFSTTGVTSGTYNIPATGETSPDVFYRVTLTVTDSNGQVHSVSRDVLPTTVAITVASNVDGAQLSVDGEPTATPLTFNSVVGLQRTLSAPPTQTLGGVTYEFTSWSDGGSASHAITTPSANTTYTAVYTPVPTPQGPTYLSDIDPVGTPVNGYGVYERDRSNGEQGAADGTMITLNGVTYSKGLGVHANSDLTFNLSGAYTSFVSDIGLDDEVGSSGSVTFQVYADGVKIYDSGSMTGASATKSVSLNVAGKSTLRLVVNAGASVKFDHADWAGARLVT